MVEAIYNGKVIARSNRTQVVEGNHYFPPDALVTEYLVHSDTRTVCGWKGTASYYHVEVDGQRATDAAWYYPTPKPAAEEIRGYVAFWRGVRVEAG
ncbi:MAG: DUF427 domain-containing protein [Myxococcales bacterium]|nr:DUF427 domain-containing protein [Myxococcales bacterium]